MKIEDLKIVFENIRGNAFIGIDTETPNVKLTGGKKNRFQGRVSKITMGSNVAVCFGEESAYANAVKKKMAAAGEDPSTFELKPRAWGTRIPGTPFIEHNGNTYLECIFVHPGRSIYYVDNVETDKSLIEGLPVKKETEEPKDEVIIRCYNVENILAVRYRGEWR